MKNSKKAKPLAKGRNLANSKKSSKSGSTALHPSKQLSKHSSKHLLKSSPKTAGASKLKTTSKSAEKTTKTAVKAPTAKGKTAQSSIARSTQTSLEKAAKSGAQRGKKGTASLNAEVAEIRSDIYGPVNSAGEAVCREVACEGLVTSGGYCRLHYIKNWKKIKRKELILKEGKLNQYIEELVIKYPDKYIEAIRSDLASDKEFNKVIHDLELDEAIDDFDVDSESADHLIDNIKREIDDEGDVY